jgi:branched-chain amino acid transport system substrate-binding protein
MRRIPIWTGALLATAVLALGACSSSSSSNAPANDAGATSSSSGGGGSNASSPIVLGAAFDMSGALAQLGKNSDTALNIWVNKVNAAGGVNGRKVEIDLQDAQSSPQGAAAAFRALVNAKVPAVIGPFQAADCNLVQSIAEQTHTVVYCMSGAQFTWTTHFFAGGFPPNIELGAVPLLWIKQKTGTNKVGCIATDDASGASYGGALKAEASAVGVQVVTQDFEATDTDVSSQIQKLKAAGVGGIAICTSGAATLTALRGIQAVGFQGPVVLGFGNLSLASQVAKVMSPGGDYAAVEYASFPAHMPASYPEAADVRFFSSAYQKATGVAPDNLPLQVVDGLQLYLDAISHGATTGDEIAKFLTTVKNFCGVLTCYSMSATDHRGTTPSYLIAQVDPNGTASYAGSVKPLGNG